MSFNEMILATEAETNTFETFFNNCIMFAEASYKEYKTNLKEAELKVIQESGTAENLIYLENEANEGFIVRAGKTIKKMVESFLDWLSKIIESIKEFLTGKTTKEALDKADKAIENNPKLKSSKIEIIDLEKIEKLCDKHEAMIDKKIAMFKAKKFSSDDKKELDKIGKSFDDESDKVRTVTVAVVLAAAIGMGTVLLTKLEKQKKEVTEIKVPDAETTDNPEQMESYVNAYALKLRINKEKANAIQSAIKDVFKGIKGAVTGSGEINPEIGATKKDKNDDSEVKESVIDEDSYLNSLFTEIEEAAEQVSEKPDDKEDTEVQESFDDYDSSIESSVESNALEKYLEALEKEIETIEEDSTPIEESTDNTTDEEYVTYEEYLESMENELFSESENDMDEIEEYLVKLESELLGKETDTIEESVEDRVERLSGILSEIENSI